MKFCRLIFYVVILQIINSGLANSVAKTEAPASSAGTTIDHDLNNSSAEAELDAVPSVKTATIEKVPPDAFKDAPAEISENVGQASQIQSSFDDIPKPKVADVAVSEKLAGVLNQGTLSQDLPDPVTIGVVSLVDSASADLHQLASSASADVSPDADGGKASSANATAGSAPAIVILPPSDVDHAEPKDKPAEKTDSTTTGAKNPSSDSPQTPVIRAEPKIVEQIPKVIEKTDPIIVDAEKNAQQIGQGPNKPPEPAVSPPSPAGSPLDLVGVPQIPQEEIPSFSEWTQKQLEEAEKKKGQNKTTSPPQSRGPAPSKMRSKNYASPDCGAKIVAANPEAEYPNGVLSNSKDEYLINRCSTQRMWLIIELCEAIQAKQIELANFELFSSSPKDFSVYLSHNHPSREWNSVGQFTAKDERNVQSFDLSPHLFGKFLKVEFNSHYGKEHFCCTSLIRVYGTSEFEVLETENEVHSAIHDIDDEDEDEQPIGADMGKPAKNLFGHATDAVFTIVRKAAEVLVKSGDSQNQSQTIDAKNSTALIPSYRVAPRHCNTLRHLVVCNNCSEDFFDQVYHLLSCHSSDLDALIESPFVFDGINNSQLCSFYGLDFISKRNSGAPLRLRNEDQLDQAGYLAAMLPAEYISALCNMLAASEGKVVLNNSQAAKAYQNMRLNSPSQDSDLKNLLIEHQAPQTCSVDASFTLAHCQPSLSGTTSLHTPDVSTSLPGSQPGPTSFSSIASEIKPTKTLSKEEAKEISSPDGLAPQLPVQKSGSMPDVVATVSSQSHVNVEPSVVLVSMNAPAEKVHDTPHEAVAPEQPVLEVPPLDRDKDLSDVSFGLDSGASDDQEPSKDLEALIMEMKALDNNEETSTETSSSFGSGAATTSSSVVTQTRVPTQQAQKESVFLRLSNKIKALERNMSLSGQYLEELSRRYKKQEELSRALNKTLNLLKEEVKRSKDREQQRDSDLLFLRTQLIQITATLESHQTEKDSWQHKVIVIGQHFLLIVIEVIMIGVVVWMCRRFHSESEAVSSGPQRKWSTGWRKVNKSHVKQLRRRSSLDGLSGSRSDLRKRRPSEEALKISGSYKDLLLQDDNVVIVEGVDITPEGNDTSSWFSVTGSREQRRKKKRRKEGLMKSSSSNNLAQLQVEKSQAVTRKISAPLHSFSLPSEHCKNSIDGDTGMLSSPMREVERDDCISEGALVPELSSLWNRNAEPLDGIVIPATYIETATSLRNRRSSNLAESQLLFNSPPWSHHEGDSGSSVSGQSSRSKGLDSLEPVCNSSQSDNQGSALSDKKKKVVKKGGLKSMVKKFF
ncbi:SUN domain-containing ossification factor [Thrips palmi]|uniref:SUN domain-containing ossification factor n=1 Tax=Thrips palmi TaxID=161013 RepID=A0A6P8YJV0_THRPL|nr:SUN domain-containing ossification factor [Thrips palmi]